MALVEARDPGGLEALREHDDREIGEARVEVGVPTLEPEDGRVLTGVEALDPVPPGGDVLEEEQAGSTPSSAAEEEVDLGSHRSRHHELSRLISEDGFRSRLARISPVVHRDDYARVDDEGHSPKPWSSSPSS